MTNIFALDFDHTLVESNKPYDVAKRAVCKLMGVTEDVFDATYKAHQKYYGFHFPLLHVVAMTQDSKLVAKAMEAYQVYYTEFGSSLFDDSLESIEALRRYGKVVVISSGERAHQLAAIVSSGIYWHCDGVRVVEKKTPEEIVCCIDTLGELPEQVFSLGDRVSDAKVFKTYSQQTGIPVVGVRIRRPQGKYFAEEDLEKVVDAEFPDICSFVKELDKGRWKFQ